ncbi:hypothetical protein [Streptomyces solicathayae]|uniref:Uncharacterized protein n=1 Tax=Streptomyces solicathayae TaxID=3081768 RepID=A0ABZ0LKH2_9ACTN|nr:hypothetical protein [Streptomyces sp. HUAS YS2]WOX20013.1 hypothetical protein R2D22_00810 [Streptomyces sp. HUAS YS2]
MTFTPPDEEHPAALLGVYWLDRTHGVHGGSGRCRQRSERLSSVVLYVMTALAATSVLAALAGALESP